MRHAVLTAIGDDRPGLVAEVTRYVLERGGNLEDSRMVNLHGQFVQYHHDLHAIIQISKQLSVPSHALILPG